VLLFLNYAEAIIIVQSHRQFGEIVIGDASAELAIERVGGRLPQRKPVDFLDYLGQLWNVEQRTLYAICVAFEPFIGAEAGAGRPPQLPATDFSSATRNSTPLRTRL
jgi:hypothetical protein